VRDPTAFIKKSQLTTPAGFDHDFNFLSGLERGMLKEKDDKSSLLQVVKEEDSSDRLRREKRGEFFYRRCRAMGITVYTAPKGMLRERQNDSRIAKRFAIAIILSEKLH
jgi:hypothetical protein